MVINKKKLSIQLLAIIGLALSIELAIIFYVANYQKYALSSFCSINDFVDCDGVARTVAAQFLGIPLAYWGMFLYVTILFLTFVDKLKNCRFLKFLEVFKNPIEYVATLGSIAFLCSIVLAGISIYKLNKICVLCFVTYIVDLIIALVASDGMFKNIASSFKTTFTDFVDGAKKYTKTFIVLLILATSFLAYSGITYNFVPHIKKQKAILKYRNMKKNPYRVEGNLLGNENADVVIELYSDYVCPLCYIHNIMLHQAVREFYNIKVIHHNYPFDKECNKYINTNMHPKACIMAKAALAAEKQGRYWGMSSSLYENQPNSVENLIKLAEEIGLDKDRFISDFESNEVDRILLEQIDEAASKNIDSTPTMFINGHEEVGVTPYYVLREKLIKYGAKRK